MLSSWWPFLFHTNSMLQAMVFTSALLFSGSDDKQPSKDLAFEAEGTSDRESHSSCWKLR